MFEQITEKDYDRLTNEHGDLFVTETLQGEIYTRRAKRAEIDRAKVKSDKGQAILATDELAISCAVWPEKAKLRAAFDKFPLLSEDVASTIILVAKGDERQLAKKP